MKARPDGFISEKQIDHNGEIFDYISELHEYLWRFVRTVMPMASGNLKDYVDICLREREAESRTFHALRRKILWK